MPKKSLVKVKRAAKKRMRTEIQIRQIMAIINSKLGWGVRLDVACETAGIHTSNYYSWKRKYYDPADIAKAVTKRTLGVIVKTSTKEEANSLILKENAALRNENQRLKDKIIEMILAE